MTKVMTLERTQEQQNERLDRHSRKINRLKKVVENHAENIEGIATYQ